MYAVPSRKLCESAFLIRYKAIGVRRKRMQSAAADDTLAYEFATNVYPKNYYSWFL